MEVLDGLFGRKKKLRIFFLALKIDINIWVLNQNRGEKPKMDGENKVGPY